MDSLKQSKDLTCTILSNLKTTFHVSILHFSNMLPEAMTVHDRNSISFGNFLADTANYNVACSSDPLAARSVKVGLVTVH